MEIPQQPYQSAPKKNISPALLTGLIVLVLVGGYASIAKYQSLWPFSSWKTYTNTEYGFEFRYPSDYSTVNPGMEQEGWPQGVVLLSYKPHPTAYSLAIEAWDTPTAFKEKYGEVQTKKSFIKQIGNKYLSVWALDPEDIVLDQILSTFKFTK